MKWITRERPKIDRVACPWLIARFIDPEPEFLFVAPERVLEVARETGAIPYDVPGAPLSHEGERCSFDAFLAKYELDDPLLHGTSPEAPPGRVTRGRRTSARGASLRVTGRLR